jgi:hypothetical protein
VLIDECDKPYRDGKRDENDELLRQLDHIFELGQMHSTGISLFLLSGITRIAVRDICHVDASSKTIYHGLCGISAQEFIESANGQLDRFTKKIYRGQTLKEVLKSTFGPTWSGFNFGFDDDCIDRLDPKSPEGALFSPLDVWEIVTSLLDGNPKPKPRWIYTIGPEFDCTSLAVRYMSTRGFEEFLKNVEGGWVDKLSFNFIMNREDYMVLGCNMHVQRFLLEIGLLTVKSIDDDFQIKLGTPNDLVQGFAKQLLEKQRKYSLTCSLSYAQWNGKRKSIDYINLYKLTVSSDL